jgi:hypothetical protein
MSSVRAFVRPSLEIKSTNSQKKQAEAVEILVQAYESGLHRMHQGEVMGRLNSSQRIGQLFKGPPAYGTLILGIITVTTGSLCSHPERRRAGQAMVDEGQPAPSARG